MTNDFFPADYEVPKSPSDYMKLDNGANELRFLSTPLMGYLNWTTDKKPARSPTPFEGTPGDARLTMTSQAEAFRGDRCLELRREARPDTRNHPSEHSGANP